MVRYKGRFLLIVVLGMLSLLLFAPQSFANAPSTLSSMLSEESQQQFKELTPYIQSVINDSLFPQILKKVHPEGQRAALEAIVSTTHEQQADEAAGGTRSDYYYGIHWQMNGSVAWTMSTIGAQYHIECEINVKSPPLDVCEEDSATCDNCTGITAYVSWPREPGSYVFESWHKGQVEEDGWIWQRKTFKDEVKFE